MVLKKVSCGALFGGLLLGLFSGGWRGRWGHFLWAFLTINGDRLDGWRRREIRRESHRSVGHMQGFSGEGSVKGLREREREFLGFGCLVLSKRKEEDFDLGR